ncbi:MAG TPA: ATP-binding protein [Candidatus Angelobacter sp.]|nr:ATP-binding protein [Candidatus Angelobacter sp.]
MSILFDQLPTILVLAVLVGIFVALGRHVKSERLVLWTTAWILIFAHAVAKFMLPVAGALAPTFSGFAQSALALAALCFVASLTSFFENKTVTIALLTLCGVPAMVYNLALAYQSDERWIYMVCLEFVFLGTPLFIALSRRLTVEAFGWMPLCIISGVLTIQHAWHHDYNFGRLAFLTIGFALPAFLFCRRYPRLSSGVIASACGFLLWGASFTFQSLATVWPALHLSQELWNTPRFFVALGMMLTLLEDKSEFLKSARVRERELNRQLQRFAGITSGLLTGVDINSMCHEIALAVMETSTFQRVVIVLGTDGGALVAAGHAGYEPEAVRHIEHRCANVWRIDMIEQACQAGVKLGENSYRLEPAEVDQYGPAPSTRQFEPNDYWENGSAVIVPLLSTRGAVLGCLAMDDPRDVARVTAEEMSQIELLAGDLAVTIDNAALHRQLVRSEKLAAIGQLVAGVAHELNNPLTSIVGYSELLTDEVGPGTAREKLDKMIREAQRMRRIIENLLRFARQNSLEKKSTSLKPLLQEVLALGEYHLRENNVEVKVNVAPNLPQVALDEDQFKQILLNLLNNSVDAMENVRRKRIRIEAFLQEDRVVVRFDDNGPGFTDTSRAFDPFFTTKPVGKGTGLGLSICYGIVKEHGGEILATNLEPNGARIVLELPVQNGTRTAGAVSVS